MHVLNIIGHPGHQPTDRIFRKKGYGKRLNMLKKAQAKIMHNLLAGIFHNHLLEKVKTEARDNEDEKDGGGQCDSADIVTAEPGKVPGIDPVEVAEFNS